MVIKYLLDFNHDVEYMTTILYSDATTAKNLAIIAQNVINLGQHVLIVLDSTDPMLAEGRKTKGQNAAKIANLPTKK